MSKLLDTAVAWASAGFSVIPVGSDKIPKIKWSDCQTNPWTVEQVEEWWNKNPTDNIAVIPGSNGFGVIDGDIYKEGGSESLGQLFLDHGLSKQGVPICRTGRGGLHFWFRCPAGIPSGPLTPSVDIKSSGGYVLVPPSSNAAGPYEWIGNSPLDCPIAPSMPNSLLQTILKRGSSTRPAIGRDGRTLDQNHGWDELKSKINSSRPKLTEALRLAANDDQPLKRRLSRREFIIEPWDSNDFPGDDSYLVDGLLSPAALSVLYGPSNSGKTFQAMALAFAVGTGTPFYGMNTARGRVVYLAAEGVTNIRKRRAAIKQHFRDQITKLDEPPAVDLIGDSFDLASGLDDVEALAEAIGDAKLIIVDTLAAGVGGGGDENTAPTMLAIVKAANHLIKATGAHVMLVHHMGKNQERGARGHSSLRAALDTEIECKMTAGTGTGRLRVTKQRDMEMGPPLGFKLVPVTIGTNKFTEITSCIVEQTNYQEANKPKSEFVRRLETIIYNKLCAPSRLAQEPQQIEVNGTMIAVIDAIDVKPIRAAFYGLPENEDVSQDTARRRYQRAIKDVCSHGRFVFGSGKIGLVHAYDEQQA